MKTVWTTGEIDAPAAVVWSLLTDPNQWPNWGPSVRSAALDDGKFEQGSTGTVTTPVRLTLRFEVTEFVDGARWDWKVAGVPATRHTVDALGPDRCRVGFGVPWVIAPYLAACKVALRRLEKLAESQQLAMEVTA